MQGLLLALFNEENIWLCTEFSQGKLVDVLAQDFFQLLCNMQSAFCTVYNLLAGSFKVCLLLGD